MAAQYQAAAGESMTALALSEQFRSILVEALVLTASGLAANRVQDSGSAMPGGLVKTTVAELADGAGLEVVSTALRFTAADRWLTDAAECVPVPLSVTIAAAEDHQRTQLA